ncbi:MAG: hypothetical protein V4674_00695 [Patescibacteria group bacterium]
MRLKSAAALLLSKTYEDVWYRGAAYAAKGRVKITKSDKHEVRGMVSGTQDYFVALAFSGAGLARRCTCPYNKLASRTVACKHLAALAIVWDASRDIAPPTRDEIDSKTITPPFISYKDIDDAYTDPLHADLEVLRLMASESGVWSKAHARLPLSPRFAREAKLPLVIADVKKAVKEITRWAGHPAYDRAFCAGEMIAGFCELIRLIALRVPVTPPFVAAEILRELQKAHYALIGDLVEDSDGLYIFSEVHLDWMHMLLKKVRLPAEDRAPFDAKLWEYEIHKDEY